uniref:Uncharacterized protein n=1 Tax=Siphoviridae sp. ctHhH6 TaxID=2825422 RepID=A0A8S5QEM1_9CAUD|nr:MAG TPA: hypothetical protein [Siphoviridae sp. ctHhH6]
MFYFRHINTPLYPRNNKKRPIITTTNQKILIINLNISFFILLFKVNDDRLQS